jgi:hypothetical protein
MRFRRGVLSLLFCLAILSMSGCEGVGVGVGYDEWPGYGPDYYGPGYYGPDYYGGVVVVDGHRHFHDWDHGGHFNAFHGDGHGHEAVRGRASIGGRSFGGGHGGGGHRR